MDINLILGKQIIEFFFELSLVFVLISFTFLLVVRFVLGMATFKSL